MTKIATFGRNEHALVSNRVIAALKALETELGVKFDTSGGQVGTAGGYIKLEVKVLDSGNGKSGAQVEYERNAWVLGLKDEWFGKPFYMSGVEYKIVGINVGSPKYGLMIERLRDGKQFKATVAGVKSGLEAAVAAGRIAA
jgi:hypothetical protein